MFKFFDLQLKADKIFIKKTIHIDPALIHLIDQRLLGDKSFMLELILINKELYQFASEDIRNDYNMAKTVIIDYDNA